MDQFYSIGLLVIGSVCIQLSSAAVLSFPSEPSRLRAKNEARTNSGSTLTSDNGFIIGALNNVTSCPRFDNRQENQTLYVPYIVGRCEMVVTVETVRLPPLNIIKMFKRGKNVIRRPVVSFRPVVTEEDREPVTCEALPTRSLGPFVFVDTVVNECQMLLRIQRQKNESFPPRSPGQRSRKDKKRERKQGNKKGKRPKHPRHTFVPAYEYLDEVVY